MGLQTLYTASTGMSALEQRLDTIANNLANVNTTAFKKDRANTEDLFYRHLVLPGQQDAQGNLTPTGIAIGLGTDVQSTQTDYIQGAMRNTKRQLDVAIEGNGFFTVQDVDGNIVYTRAGNLNLNDQGILVVGSASAGRLLDPPITIPLDATDIQISQNGIVSFRQSGQQQLQQAGNIQLAQFFNNDGLLKLGENLYAETEASGTATLSEPGLDGLGVLRQNFLELSNVEPVEELIDLITTQRAFELNSQAVQAGDQILQLVANLRRF